MKQLSRLRNQLRGPVGSERPGIGFASSILLLIALCASPAMAEVVGMQISVTNIDEVTRTVDFDVTAFETQYPSGLPFGEPIDRVLSQTYSTVLANYYGLGSVNYLILLGAESDWNTFMPPAIDFGDGSGVLTTTLGFQSTTTIGGVIHNIYRSGAFSHTYANKGTFTITATAGPDGDPGFPGLGNPGTVNIVAGSAQTGTLVNDFFVRRTVYATSNLVTPVLQFDASTVLSYANTIRSITNVAPVVLGNLVEIPTLSTPWLLLLAWLLGGAGLLLLRRS